MSRSHFWRVFATASAFACSLGVASTARADVVLDINPTYAASLPRYKADGVTPVTKRANFTPEGINYQDCLDNLVITFPLVYSGFDNTAKLQVWAGPGTTQCDIPTNQQGVSQQCWLLATVDRFVNPEVKLHVRDIMSGVGKGTAAQPKKDEGNCGSIDLTTISVQFLYYSGGATTQTSIPPKTVALSFDTIGPDAPTGLKILPGNHRIKVEWTSISGGDPDAGTSGGSSNLNGVRVYCDKESQVAAAPAQCHDETVDSGTTTPTDEDGGDAGEAVAEPETTKVCEDAGTTTATCGSAHLASSDGTPLSPSAALDQYKCGEVNGSTGTSVYADNLENDVQYAVAVSGRDPFGNFGPLSPITCETPSITTDFWDEYRKAGGAAGGGCASSGTSPPLGTAAAAITALTVAISSFTRRRKRR